MRRLLLILFIITLALPCYGQQQIARMNPYVAGVVVAAAGIDYSDITLFWRAEALQMTTGDKYGTDSLWSVNSAAAINTDAVKTGTNGLDCPTTADYVSLDNNSEYITSAMTLRIAFWLKVNTWANDATIFVADMAGSNSMMVFMAGGSELYIYWQGDSEADNFTTSGAGLNDAAWHFIEIKVDVGNNAMQCWVDNVSKGSSSATLTAWTSTTGFIAVGDNGGGASDFYVDLFMISTNATQSLYGLRDNTSTP